ncbi:MAG TPA: 2,3-bisphosphoglycerate-independent phosphoglycerate mutase [Anaerolineae bacterium]|nr:2,3-bisphosphoglycerate-independent phosphoglycerate mutase [Anaerolineae bacterium]
MADFELLKDLIAPNQTKIVLLVMDGLGGIPREPNGPTELEFAKTPNLDRLATEGSLGLIVPVRAGITPGSGPAHLALFGYDAVEHQIGRGVLESLGIGFDLQPDDVAARGNFCTVDEAGNIIDRRAGRIPTAKCVELCNKLRPIALPGVEVFVEPVKDYRFCLILRGPGLDPRVEDTDPQRKAPPLPARAVVPEAQPTADLFNQWIAKAREVLKNEHPANMLTLRGIASDPGLPRFPDVYGLRSACVAVYPMYKGVSRLVGMDVIEFDGETPADEFAAVKSFWDTYDFFFVHVKPTDSRGEDGDFEAKAKVIESVDAALPALLDLKPAVLMVTGDHATPSVLKTHSWHPVPTLVWAPGATRRDPGQAFGETECLKGALGIFPATDLMPLALAHAKRLQKFGA